MKSDERGRDRRLTAALRAVVPQVPYDEVDFDGLARRIGDAAAQLHPRVAPPRWWEHAARWSRSFVPLALAAGVAGLVVATQLDSGSDTPVANQTVAVQPAGVTAMLTGVSSEQEAVGTVAGTSESFLAEVFGQ